MKIKFLSLFLAFGLLAVGTMANAEDPKFGGQTRITGMEDVASEALCSGGAPTDACNSQYNSVVCAAYCTALSKAHDLVVGKICKDSAITSSNYSSCQNLCKSSGTLSDLACCLQNVRSSVSWTLDSEIAGVCTAVSAANKISPICSTFPFLATYGQYLCCELGMTSTAITPCLNTASLSCTGFTPDPACPAAPEVHKKRESETKK